jgi:hypothetical protein
MEHSIILRSRQTDVLVAERYRNPICLRKTYVTDLADLFGAKFEADAVGLALDPLITAGLIEKRLNKNGHASWGLAAARGEVRSDPVQQGLRAFRRHRPFHRRSEGRQEEEGGAVS